MQEKLLIYGSLKDEIQLSIEIKRGNEEKIINEVMPQITRLVGYEPFNHQGGNHIKFESRETKEIFYCIEWHDINEELNFNIIKRVCKEQGLTYRQLGDLIGYSESAIKSAMVKDEISEPMNKAIQMQLEIIRLKRELQQFVKFKNFIKQISK